MSQASASSRATAFSGIVTTRDMTHKVLAAGLDPSSPVSQVMTADPVSLPPSALGSDILHLMLERRIGHLPVVEDGRLVGMVTQTDLTRFQAVSSASLVRDAATAETVAEMAAVTARIPQLLTQLVGGHNAHEVVTRLVTDIADTVTRRLLAMAEAELGPPPVPYLWLACGSQGRQEQTGVSDQDNCLFIDDAATPDDIAYFAAPRPLRLRRAERLRLCLLPRRHDGDEPAMVPADARLARLFPRAGSHGPTRWRRCCPRSCSTCARSAGRPGCSTTCRPKRWRWPRATRSSWPT